MERTFEGFRGFTSCLEVTNEKGVIYGTGFWQMGDIKGSKAMERAYETGKAVWLGRGNNEQSWIIRQGTEQLSRDI